MSEMYRVVVEVEKREMDWVLESAKCFSLQEFIGQAVADAMAAEVGLDEEPYRVPVVVDGQVVQVEVHPGAEAD